MWHHLPTVTYSFNFFYQVIYCSMIYFICFALQFTEIQPPSFSFFSSLLLETIDSSSIQIHLWPLLHLNFVFSDHLNGKSPSLHESPYFPPSMKGWVSAKLEFDWLTHSESRFPSLPYTDEMEQVRTLSSKSMSKMCACWPNNDCFLYQIWALREPSFMNSFGHPICGR